MSFLNPIAAIFAAAVAVPLLLALYFLKLRRQTRSVSTTMFWVQAVRDLHANTPFQRLRPSWLLLLQLLILLLFLAALARPTLGLREDHASRVIFLIDTSCSMSAKVGEQTGEGEVLSRIDEARREVLDLIGRLETGGGEVQVMLITLGREARIVQSFTSDMRLVKRVVEGIEPSDEEGRLGPALRLVEAYLGTGGEQASADGDLADVDTEVIVVSDGRFADDGPYRLEGRVRLKYVVVPASGSEGKVGLGGDDGGENVGENGGENGGGDDYKNVGIVVFSARRDYEDPTMVRVLCSLVNSGRESVKVPITLDYEGRRIEVRVVEVPGASDGDGNEGETGGAGEVGEADVLFHFRTTGGGYLRAGINLDDLLAVDNVAGMILTPPVRSSVLVVYPSDGSADSYLLDVLGILDLRSVERMDSAAFAELGKLSARERAGRLARYELIVFDRVTPSFLPSVATLSFHGLLPIEGLRFYDAGVGDGDGGVSRRILSWKRRHAIMSDVNLDSLVVADRTRISLPRNRGEVLALGSGGPIIVLLEDGGIRRVLVSFDLLESNWPLLPSMAIFLKNAVEFLTMRGQIEAGKWFRAGDPVEVGVSSSLLRSGSNGVIHITGGDVDERVDMSSLRMVTGEGGEERVVLGPFTKAGLYRVGGDGAETGGGGAKGERVVVNVLSRTESDLRPIGAITVGTERATGTGASEAVPREIWRWFAAVALVLLVVEWWVYTARARR